MRRKMLKSKIHRVTVTEASLNYEGSITIDTTLMRAADIIPFEQVHVYNVTNGERFVTYAISGEADSGTICLNGAAARKVSVGDLIIICSYASLDVESYEEFYAVNVHVDENNKIIKTA